MNYLVSGMAGRAIVCDGDSCYILFLEFPDQPKKCSLRHRATLRTLYLNDLIEGSTDDPYPFSAIYSLLRTENSIQRAVILIEALSNSADDFELCCAIQTELASMIKLDNVKETLERRLIENFHQLFPMLRKAQQVNLFGNSIVSDELSSFWGSLLSNEMIIEQVWAAWMESIESHCRTNEQVDVFTRAFQQSSICITAFHAIRDRKLDMLGSYESALDYFDNSDMQTRWNSVLDHFRSSLSKLIISIEHQTVAHFIEELRLRRSIADAYYKSAATPVHWSAPGNWVKMIHPDYSIEWPGNHHEERLNGGAIFRLTERLAQMHFSENSFRDLPQTGDGTKISTVKPALQADSNASKIDGLWNFISNAISRAMSRLSLQSRLSQAESSYSDVITLQEGVLLLQQRRWTDAHELLSTAIERRDRPEFRNALAVGLLRMKKSDDAIQLLVNSRVSMPMNQRCVATTLLYRAYMEQGDLANAKELKLSRQDMSHLPEELRTFVSLHDQATMHIYEGRTTESKRRDSYNEESYIDSSGFESLSSQLEFIEIGLISR